MIFKRIIQNIKRGRNIKTINKKTNSNLSKKTDAFNAIIEGYCATRGIVNLRGAFVGFGTYIGDNARLKNCKIGRFCSIGSNCLVVECSHPTNLVSTCPIFYNDVDFLPFNLNKQIDIKTHNKTDNDFYVEIGNDVWIGNNVLIRGGISIGDGAVVGMGAVVTKNVPPYAIVAGNPAKIIRYRFDDATIEKLLKIKWWDWDKDKIIKNSDLFLNADNFISFAIEKEK